MSARGNSARVFQSFIVLCLIYAEIRGKCKTTFITKCEKASDIPRYGKQAWKNLIIANDECSEEAFGPPSEVLKTRNFNKTRNVEEMYIAEKLVDIQSGAFDGLEKLTYLKLYKNSIKVIPRGAFGNITQLLKLDLQENSIENIQHRLFENSSISFIDLSYNKLNNIQVDMLDLPSLKKLVITHNDISLLVPNCFHRNLQHLNLDHNNLEDIHEGVMTPLKNLKELILSYNIFNAVEISYALPNLQKLDLSHNLIKEISEETFKEFGELKVLLLGYNRLTHLNPNIFPDQNSIEVVHLHENKFMNLNWQLGARLPNLREMSVGGNPWPCACLQEATTYFAEKKIRQPECEKEFFSAGVSAVCWVTSGDTCTRNEVLSQDIEEEFQKSVKYDGC